MRFKAPIIFSLIILCTSCHSLLAPEFKKVENVTVNMQGLSSAHLTADALLFNPNKNSIKIRRADVDILMDDKKVASLNKKYNITVEGNSDFTVPLDITVSMKDLNLDVISAAGALFGQSGKEVRYKGKIKVTAYGLPFSVPVDYSQNLKLKL